MVQGEGGGTARPSPVSRETTESVGRILTTHVGSFVRPPVLRDRMRASMPEDSALGDPLLEAVRQVVRRQREVGLDVVNDGEQSKIGYADYVFERLEGFEPVAVFNYTSSTLLEQREFPSLYGSPRPVAAAPQHYVCTRPIRYRGDEAIRRDIANLLDATEVFGAEALFMTAVSPGLVARHPNEHYATDDEYREAIAEALRIEYEAITSAGIVLQLDCPDIGTFLRTHDAGIEDARRYAAQCVELVNFATRHIDPAMMRMHICCGADEAPHHRDVEIAWIFEQLSVARPSGLMTVGANGRHEHEWRVWSEHRLPEGKVLIPGVVDSTSNIVEHPRTVADRILRYAGAVGRENVVASADCGFSASIRADVPLVDPEIAWAKLRSLAEGAKLASRELWPTGPQNP